MTPRALIEPIILLAFNEALDPGFNTFDDILDEEDAQKVVDLTEQRLRDYNAPLFQKLFDQEQELIQIRQQRTDLQAANTKLVLENRELKQSLSHLST